MIQIEDNQRDIQVAVLNRLQALILYVMNTRAGEEHADADQSDDLIKTCREQQNQLRRIRLELEDLFTGVCK